MKHLWKQIRRFPIGCFLAVLFVLLLTPSALSLSLDFAIKRPMTLAMVGVVEPELSYRFSDLSLTVQGNANRSMIAYQRRPTRKAKVKIPRKMRLVMKEQKGNGPLPYSEMIDRIAREHGVSPALAAAVIKVESGFKARAHSVRGARGLMQVLPATARKVGVRENIYHPEPNIRAGVRYLRLMLDRYGGDERLALAAYNAGPAAVDRYNSVPPYRETRHYVPRVLQYFQEYLKYFRDI